MENFVITSLKMYDFDFYDLRKIFHVMKNFHSFSQVFFFYIINSDHNLNSVVVTDYGYKLQIKFSFITIFRGKF